MIRNLYPVVFVGILACVSWISSCEECTDCGILYKDPVVNIKFYNIDSLLKVDSAIKVVEDSLEIVNKEIEDGNMDLDETKKQLEKIIFGLEETYQDIINGKIRIEEVNSPDAVGSLYFRNSTTNDSLTVFPFPLSMHDQSSTFIIELENRIDTLHFQYLLKENVKNSYIIIQAENLELGFSTYDSARISCKKEFCISDETTVSVYF